MEDEFESSDDVSDDDDDDSDDDLEVTSEEIGAASLRVGGGGKHEFLRGGGGGEAIYPQPVYGTDCSFLSYIVCIAKLGYHNMVTLGSVQIIDWADD